MNLNTVRHDVFSVEQLSSTASEAGTNFISDKRLGQSFYNMIRLTGPPQLYSPDFLFVSTNVAPRTA